MDVFILKYQRQMEEAFDFFFKVIKKKGAGLQPAPVKEKQKRITPKIAADVPGIFSGNRRGSALPSRGRG